MKKIFTLVTLSAFAASSFASDAAADFSLASNPNGVWTYGWSTTLGGPVTLDTVTGSLGTFMQWRGNLAGDGNPSIFKNNSGSVVTGGTVTLFPFELAMHPGPGGEYSVLRYTATSASTYFVNSSFIGRDSTSTDVHLLRNGVSVFSSAIAGYGANVGYGGLQNLAIGDTLDVCVGYGSNGTFFNDTTAVDFRVTAVPEPASLLALGLGAVALLRRRRA